MCVYVCLFRCVPFPHSHLFCGQYISASTVVYIDSSVNNYTDLNRAIKLASDGGVFGVLNETFNICIRQLPYMVCQYVYPRCNSTTKVLLPVCTDNCAEMIEMCKFGFNSLAVTNFVDSLFEVLIINCTNQFKIFGSVTSDPESCYNFYCKA